MKLKNKKHPIISIIIPVLNRVLTLKRCIDSILNQTLSNYEVIVVDDCSSDNTLEIVHNYIDSRVRCIALSKHAGAQAARNRGIQEAKGEWIAFQDSDDEWLPEKLEKQVRVLEMVDYDPWTVVHANAIWLDTEMARQLPVEVPVVEGYDIYPLLLSHPGPLFPGMLVSRVALERIHLLDEKAPSYQEWDTSIRLAKFCRFIHIQEPLFIYHLHPGETISKSKTKEIAGYRYILDKFENDIKIHCGNETWERHLSTLLTKCLDFKLWAESDKYFPLITSRNVKYRILQLCRLSHIPPYRLFRLIKAISK